MPRRVVPTGDRTDVALEDRTPLVFARHVTRDLLYFLDRELHFGQPTLERADVLRHRAPTLVQYTHFGRHLLELFEPRLEILPIDEHGLGLLRQEFQDRAIMATEGACARRALTLLTGRDQSVALLLEIGVLGPKRLEFGFRLLPIAHPFRTPGLELTLCFLELAPAGLQLDRDFFFEGGRVTQCLTAFPQPVELIAHRPLGLDQCLTPTFLAIAIVGVLELGHHRRIRGQLQS